MIRAKRRSGRTGAGTGDGTYITTLKGGVAAPGAKKVRICRKVKKEVDNRVKEIKMGGGDDYREHEDTQDRLVGGARVPLLPDAEIAVCGSDLSGTVRWRDHAVYRTAGPTDAFRTERLA